jgi:hypothetical protein
MHILMATLLVVLGSLTPAKASNDGTWCYRDFGATRSTNCSFYSPRQCLIVAGTFGGICERNLPPAPSPAKGEHKQS